MKTFLSFVVEASGKLHILDHLLAHLYAKKHKVLLFSQFTSVLDILQDYLTYREVYKYERMNVFSVLRKFQGFSFLNRSRWIGKK
jgi:SNF2 family DNA or RNA helicase